MSDTQLKIRIRLDQPVNNLVAEENPSHFQEEPTLPPSVYEYHWSRIISASLGLLLIFALLLWLASDWGTHKNAGVTIAPNNVTSSTAPRITNAPPMLLSDQPSEPDKDLTSNESTDISTLPPESEPIREDTKVLLTTPESASKSVIDAPIKPEIKPEISAFLLGTGNTQIRYPAGIIKAQLTSNIRQRAPVDAINSISLAGKPSRPIFLFLHFNQFKDKKVFVNWHYRNKRVAKVTLPIGTKDWHTHSSKILDQHRLGSWYVTVTNSTGKLLVKHNFKVTR